MVSPSYTPMHNARPRRMLVHLWQPLRGVARAQSAIPALPETSKESRNCAGMDHYIAQGASPTCMKRVTSPSCAAGAPWEGHPLYEILPTSIVSLAGDFCLTSEHCKWQLYLKSSITGTHPIDIPRQWIIACQRETGYVQDHAKPKYRYAQQGQQRSSCWFTGHFETFPMGAE
ncbi:hypothetical protein HDV64DRAFT_199803 [Trichoderma sp. TUCIM 5745]